MILLLVSCLGERLVLCLGVCIVVADWCYFRGGCVCLGFAGRVVFCLLLLLGTFRVGGFALELGFVGLDCGFSGFLGLVCLVMCFGGLGCFELLFGGCLVLCCCLGWVLLT